MTETLASLALSVLLAAAAPDAERTVCVPDDYGGWECGKGAQAPLPRALPSSVLQSAPRTSAPPPYLMDPSRRPMVTRESLDRGYLSPQRDNAPAARAPVPPAAANEMTQSAAAVVAAIPAAEPAPESLAATVEPTQAAPTVSPARPAIGTQPTRPTDVEPPNAAENSVATTAPPLAPTPDRSTQVPISAQTAPEGVTAPEAANSAANSGQTRLRPQRVISSVARETAELLALPDSAYTVQLSAARGVAGFVALRQKYGLAVEDTYVIRVRRGDDWLWLMLWRDFADLASARAAISQLPDSKGVWARNLEPLKAEVRATP